MRQLHQSFSSTKSLRVTKREVIATLTNMTILNMLHQNILIGKTSTCPPVQANFLMELNRFMEAATIVQHKNII